MVGDREVRIHHAKFLKTKSANAQQKTLPPNSAKALLNTAVDDAVNRQQDAEERIPPRETDAD